MTTPLTAAQLNSLLDILADPEHPSFTAATERLTTLDPSTLTPDLALSLQARLHTITESLAGASRLTTQQLTNLRRGNQALQSYAKK